MKKVLITIGVIAVVVIGVIVWLTNKPNNKTKPTINIAAILSLTGTGADYGNDQLRAIEIIKEALGEIDKKYNYNFVIQDSKSTPKDAIHAFNNVMAIKKIDVSMTILSTISLALQPLTEKNSIPLFCTGSHPDITSISNLIFRSLPTSDYQAESLVKSFFSYKSVNNVSILYLNDDFGIGNVQSFKNELKKHGEIKIIGEESINTNNINDSRIILSKLIKDKPECLFVAFYSKSLATILRQLKELNYKGQILTPIEVSYPEVLELAGDAANNVIFVGNTINPKNIESISFVEHFVKKYQTQPALDAIYAFDEIQVIINTIEQHGYSLDAFRKLKGNVEYNSPLGRFKINTLGDFEYELSLYTIQNGRIEKITR